jgi:hypothetical protein
MMTGADRCPKCKSEDVSRLEEDARGEDVLACDACEYTAPESEFWPTRAELGLSLTHCECCNRTLTWGCGHTNEQELAAIAHRQTTDHLLGDCDCYVSRPGYAAYYTREQRRDNIAEVLRMLEADSDQFSPHRLRDMKEALYRR